jgi:hypothetical protein
MTSSAPASLPVFTPNEAWAMAIGLSSLLGLPTLLFLAWPLSTEHTGAAAALLLGVPVVLGASFGLLLRSLPAVVVAGLVAAIACAHISAFAIEGKYVLLVLVWAVAVFPFYLLAAWLPHRLRTRRVAGGEPVTATGSSGGGGLSAGMFFGFLIALVTWSLAVGPHFSSLFAPIELACLAAGAATGGIVGFVFQRVRSSRRRTA